MSMFNTVTKRCGDFTVEVFEPFPRWVMISHRGVAIRGIQVEDLRDLRHAIDRAIALTEEDDKKAESLP